nr:hypothetical protein [Alkalicoccus halolimnae]
MGRLRGDQGRAPLRTTARRTGLAEAGLPGKRPHGNESALASLNYFIFKIAVTQRVNASCPQKNYND